MASAPTHPSECLIVLPARLRSTRLPEKLLRKVDGKSILQYTYEAASRATITSHVVVAVDDERIAREVDRFGGKWIMTDPNCASGTDRIAEVAAAMPQFNDFINVQADEPEIDPKTIDLVGHALVEHPDADMATAGTPIRDLDKLRDTACVKIVLAMPSPNADQMQWGRAVYFSRSSVPRVRDGINPQILQSEPPTHWHHIGLYAYRRSFLQWFATEPPSRLEQLEKLEQLRAIEAGKKIIVTRVESAPVGIDTQSDLDAFIRRAAHRRMG